MKAEISNEVAVNAAFSRQSAKFDSIYESNRITTWMRDRARAEVLKNIPEEGNILELNAGTGIDAVFFAQKGYRVLATDNADGMLSMLQQKIDALQLKHRLTARKCSFTKLEDLQGHRFDYVFSNFGGLNCTAHLNKVLQDIHALLKPGGYFTLVIMPRVCPWEMLTAFRGYFKTAFRRFNKNGTPAHLEGEHFNCYYYNPDYIIKRMQAGFRLVGLEGLCITVPPPYIEQFVEKHPRLFTFLENIELRIAQKAPFNRWCDHYMITMQKI